jgi:two-component system response regulator MprA
MHPVRETILVVEDDVDCREAVVAALECDGYHVLAASNGYEALILARGDVRPAMILLDLMLPVMDGWQFLSLQQSERDICGIPVVLFSGERELGRRAQELRVAGWLRKPVDLQQLLATVERAITGKSGPYPVP